mmetsp:Transcript_16948/g.23921  ORF Transcript_16948/g.23921 Transcript_16948/m.23921 type:complete len:345 (+) Transcript_16948:35-1069(+)
MTKLTEYKGLVLATIEITPSNPEHGDEVEFADSSPGGKAVFLMKVKEYESGKFKAKFVSPERAARHVELFPKLNKTNKDTSPLFVVHGFNVQPAAAMSNIADKWKRFTDAGLKYYPVPVLWPCNEDGDYATDQEGLSQRAGKELKAMVDAIPNDLFPRKSVLMHSMGNHVVFNGACGVKDETEKVIDKAPDVEFENIFLVAADVPHDIFWENPYEYDDRWFDKKKMQGLYGQKKQKASNFFKMLKVDESGKPIGKIYVVHYKWDKAMVASATPLMNGETRLGAYGHKKDGDDKVRADMKDYIEDYDMYPNILWCGGDDDQKKHSYEFEPATVEFYMSKVIEKPE